jgi:hypothetical protein
MIKQILFISIFAIQSSIGSFAFNLVHAADLPGDDCFISRGLQDRYGSRWANTVKEKNSNGDNLPWDDLCTYYEENPPSQTEAGLSECVLTPDCNTQGQGKLPTNGSGGNGGETFGSKWKRWTAGNWLWPVSLLAVGGLAYWWGYEQGKKKEKKKHEENCIYIPGQPGGYYGGQMRPDLQFIPGMNYPGMINGWNNGGGLGGWGSGGIGGGGFGGIGGGGFGGIGGGGFGGIGGGGYPGGAPGGVWTSNVWGTGGAGGGGRPRILPYLGGSPYNGGQSLYSNTNPVSWRQYDPALR